MSNGYTLAEVLFTIVAIAFSVWMARLLIALVRYLEAAT